MFFWSVVFLILAGLESLLWAQASLHQGLASVLCLIFLGLAVLFFLAGVKALRAGNVRQKPVMPPRSGEA
ncbi:MAG: hypothetical protein ACLFOY_00200 [Desulfatibacillaceae bacterium]